jgi:gas vesicle protein
MNAPPKTHGDHRFAIGLMTGTFVGAGLAIWFAPRWASELRAEAVGALARKAQDVHDDVAVAIARGGHEVERFAMAARSERASDARKPSDAASVSVEPL